MIARLMTLAALIGLLAAACTPQMEQANLPMPPPPPVESVESTEAAATDSATDSAPATAPATAPMAIPRRGEQRTARLTEAVTAMAPPLSVKRNFLRPDQQADDAAFHALLVAGSELRGGPRMAAIAQALGDLPEHGSGDVTAVEARALVQAPVNDTAGTAGPVDLACDYDWDRAAHWKDSLNRLRAGAGAGEQLGADSLGFITSARNLEAALRQGDIAAIDVSEIVYVDLSPISNGYLAEVVERLVRGLRSRDVRSHTDSLAVIRTISVFERVGEYTLALTAPLFASEASATPPDEC